MDRFLFCRFYDPPSTAAIFFRFQENCNPLVLFMGAKLSKTKEKGKCISLIDNPSPTMAAEEPEQVGERPKHRRHILRTLLILIFLLLAGIYLSLFFGLKYFGETILRDYLHEKIYLGSKGLYSVDFMRLNFNIVTGKISIDSLELIPDTQLYQQMKTQGKATKSLYRASFASLTIDRIHFWQIYSQQRVSLKQLIFDHPIISIVGFPDTATAKKARWRVVYEDIYPSISGIFKDFHVDSVKVNHGLLLTSFRHKTGKLSTGEYEFSTILRDVSVNPFSYYNRERVFYSKDIDWVVHNFELIMADSLYFLKAGEIGFSLTKRKLYGKDISLRPNFAMRGLHKRPRSEFYKLNLPAFSVEGIDLYQALIEKTVEIKNLDLNNFSMKVYRNLVTGENKKSSQNNKKFKIAGLYSVIAGALKSVAIDTLMIRNASFEYFSRLNDARPELKIGSADLGLIGFFIDSTAHLNEQKIFYAREIDLSLTNFNLNLRDQVHNLGAGHVAISTMKSQITVSDALLYPDNKRNQLFSGGKKNTIYLLLPHISFNRINLIKLFNQKIFDFDRLEIREPDIKITRYRPPGNLEPRFKNPEDFFAEENEDAVYNLLKKYVHIVKGNTISIVNGYGMIAREQERVEKSIATSHFDLEMQQFLIDSAHGLNQQGYFYSRDFKLNMYSLALMSPDGLKQIKVKRLAVTTVDSLIEAEEISLRKMSGPVEIASNQNTQMPLEFDFYLKRIRLTGLNHRRLFLEKILMANTIILEQPILRLKTENNGSIDETTEETELIRPKKFIRDFEIGRLSVKQGSVSYDGLENRKATYFSFKDIDFNLINARVHVPEKGKRDGLIRFDSLQLRILPFRAVIADSNYAVECKEVDIHSYPADITLRGLRLIPLRPLEQMTGKTIAVSASLPDLKLKGFYFDKAIFDNEWLLDKIQMNQPQIRVEIRKEPPGNKVGTRVVNRYSLKLPPFIHALNIGSVIASRADATLVIIEKERSETISLNQMSIKAHHINVDSSTLAHPENTPLFNAENIEFSAPGFAKVLKDSLYTLAFSRFGFSTKEKSAFVDSVSMLPNFDRTSFSTKSGYQADRMEIKIPRIDIQNLNFLKLLDSSQLIAKKLIINNFKFNSYRDKRLVLAPGPKPLMPQQLMNKLAIPVRIDTIGITGAEASYEEQTGKEPGRIFFNQMNILLTGFNTIRYRNTDLSAPRILTVHGTAALMGTAPVDAWFRFPLDHPRDSFTMQAKVGLLDLRDLNPMVQKLMPASITRGIAEETNIRYIHANDSLSMGFMNIRFYGLKIRLENSKPGTLNKIQKSILSWLANYILPDNNPREDGRMRTGIIYFQRDKSKGFFNFVWKSTLSGIKSSAGYNSEKQREIRRNEKNMKK